MTCEYIPLVGLYAALALKVSTLCKLNLMNHYFAGWFVLQALKHDPMMKQTSKAEKGEREKKNLK